MSRPGPACGAACCCSPPPAATRFRSCGQLADIRELDSADDRAAVLGWRLDDTGNHNGSGPLPWLPAIPQRLHDHQTWGPYLAARAAIVAELADRVRAQRRR